MTENKPFVVELEEILLLKFTPVLRVTICTEHTRSRNMAVIFKGNSVTNVFVVTILNIQGLEITTVEFVTIY